jgi:hypothetical protein
MLLRKGLKAADLALAFAVLGSPKPTTAALLQAVWFTAVKANRVD